MTPFPGIDAIIGLSAIHNLSIKVYGIHARAGVRA